MSIPSGSHCIDVLLKEFRDNIGEVPFGEVGIIFTMHNSAVTKVRKIKALKLKISHNNGKADLEHETEEMIHYNGE